MSDSTDFTIVIILLFGLIIYVLFINKIIKAYYDINNIKCNPVNLFLKSINAEASESIDDFAECVQLLGPNRNTPITNSSKTEGSVNDLLDTFNT